MCRHGFTAGGKQRWYCSCCHRSGVKARSDQRLRADRSRFLNWLVRGKSLVDVAESMGISIQTLLTRFTPFWQEFPCPKLPESMFGQVLILDATYLEGRYEVLLIARTPQRVISWQFAKQECKASWLNLLQDIPAPFAVVMDGQKGLLAAVKQIWPKAKVQRCLAHITRRAHSKLTQNPTTEAGCRLKQLAYQLTDVETKQAKRLWCKKFSRWQKRYGLLINQKTWSENHRHWWYTHKNLRHTARLLQGNLDRIFTYIRYRFVPRTTNHLEGGINSRISELLFRHRGMKLSHKQIMLAYFLSQKQS